MNFIHGVGLTGMTMALLGVTLYVGPLLVLMIVSLLSWMFGF